MTVRLDQINGLKADMHTWFWESADPVYKNLRTFYDKIAVIGNLEDIVGGFWKGTSALGAMRLQDRTSLGKYVEDRPQEGYSVYALIKDKALKVQCPRELKRDWHRTRDWLKDYVKENWPKAVEFTKEELVADVYNKGGYTSGNSIFNNDSSDLNLSTYSSPNLCYDGYPFINRDGNDRAAKFQSTGTFYNGLSVTTGDLSAGVTYNNAKDMINLLQAINNRDDSGRYFDNSQGKQILCHPRLESDWKVVNESTLNPDNARNASNPIKGAFDEIIPNPYLDSNVFSAIVRKGVAGVKAYFGTPRFDFWEEKDPEAYWASVILDYAIAVKNWRPVVGNNAPTS